MKQPLTIKLIMVIQGQGQKKFQLAPIRLIKIKLGENDPGYERSL